MLRKKNGGQEKFRNYNWQRFCYWLNKVTSKRKKPRLVVNRVDVNWILAQGQIANRCEGFGPCSKCVHLTLYTFETRIMMAKHCRIWISRQKMMHSDMYKVHWGDNCKCIVNGSWKKSKSCHLEFDMIIYTKHIVWGSFILHLYLVCKNNTHKYNIHKPWKAIIS